MELRTLLETMDKHGASDLHLVAGMPPILRIQGALWPLDRVPDEPSAVRILSAMDLNALAEQMEGLAGARPEGAGRRSRRWAIELGTRGYYARASSSKGQECLWVRSIQPHIPTMQELDLPPALMQIAGIRRGLVVIAGPIGCGKQTTACAMIEHINRNRPDSQRIMTVEDGPAYLLASKMSLVTQHLVGIDCESMADGITQVQAMDPDIVFLGEVMDEESILGALRLADRSHLVITTLHADGVGDAIGRLYDLAPTHAGLVRRQLSKNLAAVVSQRLLLRSFEKGRVSVQEILLNNGHVRERLARGDTDLTDLIESGRSEGMQTFDDAFLDLLARGAISYQVARDNIRDLRRLPEPP
jgi:pilus retraction protein PilT